MWIKELHMKNFGKFSDKKIELSPGINLIYGENESGKSTMHTFIRSCLYGMRKMRGRASKKDDYSHYQPWDNSNYYAGNIRFVCGDKVFRLERDFLNGTGGGILVCETDGELLSLESGDLDMLLGGVGEVAFLNTVSIGQLKNETDDGLISELQNYIANFQESGDRTIDMDKALQLMKNQKKELERQILKEREKQDGKIRQLSDYMGYLNEEIVSDRQKLQEVEGDIVFTKCLLKDIENVRMKKQKTEKEETYDMEENPEDIIGGEMEEEPDETLEDGWKERVRKADIGETFEIPKTILLVETVILAIMFAFCYMIKDFGFFKDLIVLMGMITIVVMCGRWLIKRWSYGELSGEDSRDDYNMGEDYTDGTYDSDHDILSEEADFYEESKKANSALEKLYWQREHLTSEIEEKQTLVENCQQDIQAYEEKRGGEKMRLQKENKEALEMAAKRMQEVMGQMQGTIGVLLKKRTSEIFGEITNGYYTQVQMEDNLCTGVHMKDRYVPLEQLSRGTIWQVYFAYRMAAGEILAQEEPLPIMLDDAFVMYDEGRLAQVLAWLAKQEKQILVFTCQKREKELLEQLGVVYHEVVL